VVLPKSPKPQSCCQISRGKRKIVCSLDNSPGLGFRFRVLGFKLVLGRWAGLSFALVWQVDLK
jgi:hypothetical protein